MKPHSFGFFLNTRTSTPVPVFVRYAEQNVSYIVEKFSLDPMMAVVDLLETASHARREDDNLCLNCFTWYWENFASRSKWEVFYPGGISLSKKFARFFSMIYIAGVNIVVIGNNALQFHQPCIKGVTHSSEQTFS